jgi:hypothetical protein
MSFQELVLSRFLSRFFSGSGVDTMERIPQILEQNYSNSEPGSVLIQERKM